MNALSPAEPEGEREGAGEVTRIGEFELVVGHGRNDSGDPERIKNKSPASALPAAWLRVCAHGVTGALR
jgi:hypothetical protein